jgi:hypothetical protein
MTTAIAPTIWPIALIASQFTSQFVPNHSAFRKRNHACGRTLWIADAHRDDGKRYVVRVNEKLADFLELESAIPDLLVSRTHALLSATAQAQKRYD